MRCRERLPLSNDMLSGNMFIHSPLDRDRREVRLVRFTRAALEVADATIALELRHASLDDDIPYAAMSYVWGDASDPIQIDINDKPFLIGRNLHAGLQRLRNEGVESLLWIDAICIQQSDTDEKSWQVDQMRDVYRLAELVYIWLGPSSPEIDVAMGFLARFGPGALACGALDLNAMTHDDRHIKGIFAYLDSHFNNPPTTAKPDSASSHLDTHPNPPPASTADSDHNPEHDPSDDPNQDHASNCDSDSEHHHPTPHPDLPPFIHALLTHLGLLSPHHPLQPGLLTLLSNPYWSRVWIIQDAALARHALLLYGTTPDTNPNNRNPSTDHSTITTPTPISLDAMHATLTLIWYTLSSGLISHYHPHSPTSA